MNNYTGTFKLAKTSIGNADYSVFIENAFSDTHGDGTVENYSIYQRVTMPAVDAHRPVTICYDDDVPVAVNLLDISSLNLYQGQDTVITALILMDMQLRGRLKKSGVVHTLKVLFKQKT